MLKVYCNIRKTERRRGLPGLLGSKVTHGRDLMLTREEARDFIAKGWAVHVHVCRKAWVLLSMSTIGRATALSMGHDAPPGMWEHTEPHTRVSFDDRPKLIPSNWP